MCVKASNSKGDARTVGYEGGKIHCLWRALEQGLFPFMMNEVGELTEKNKVFVAVCEAAVKPETFEYAKWKGIGHSPAFREFHTPRPGNGDLRRVADLDGHSKRRLGLLRDAQERTASEKAVENEVVHQHRADDY